MTDADRGLYLKLKNGDTGAIVGDRIFPDLAPQNTKLPRLVYTRISTIRAPMAMSGPVGLARVRFQVDGYGVTKGDIRALASAIREDLDGAKGDIGGGEEAQLVMVLDEQEFSDPPTDSSEAPVRRVRFDIVIIHNESRPNQIGV